MRVAAVDVGTNTVRLLVADVHAGGLPVHLERCLEITRLGRGVDERRRLDPETVRRTLEVVGGFVDRARDAGAERIRVAGTSALRDAEDREDFLTAVRDRTGIDLEILDGAQEGALAFVGATADLPEGPFCVVDIGGGSTELIRGRAGAEVVRSVDLGSVRVRERCLRSDPPTPDEVQEAEAFVRERLGEVVSDLGLDGGETLVGVAGTITTLAAVIGGIVPYDPERIHGVRITSVEIDEWRDRLLGLTTAEVRALGPVEPGRADVLPAGVLILREIVRHWGFEEIVVSERDILDGLVRTAAAG